MDFSIKPVDARTSVQSIKTGCLVVGVFEEKQLTSAARELDRKGALTAILKSGDITGKSGSTLLLHGIEGAAAERLLLVGLGAEGTLAEKAWQSAIQAAGRVLATLGAADAMLALPLDQLK